MSSEGLLSLERSAAGSGTDFANYAARQAQVPDAATQQYDSTEELKELVDNKEKLSELVANLRQDLTEWKLRIRQELKSYQADIQDMHTELGSQLNLLEKEYAGVKTGFQASREANKQVYRMPRFMDDQLEE